MNMSQKRSFRCILSTTEFSTNSETQVAQRQSRWLSSDMAPTPSLRTMAQAMTLRSCGNTWKRLGRKKYHQDILKHPVLRKISKPSINKNLKPIRTIRNPTIKNKIILFFVCVRKSLICVWSPQTLTYYILHITN